MAQKAYTRRLSLHTHPTWNLDTADYVLVTYRERDMLWAGKWLFFLLFFFFFFKLFWPLHPIGSFKSWYLGHGDRIQIFKLDCNIFVTCACLALVNAYYFSFFFSSLSFLFFCLLLVFFSNLVFSFFFVNNFMHGWVPKVLVDITRRIYITTEVQTFRVK